MREDIIIKGANGELQLILNETADFTAVLAQLKEKLRSAADFFGGGMGIRLPAVLTSEQRIQIAEVLSEHGLSCLEPAQCAEPEIAEQAPAAVKERDRYEINALVVGKTVRSGQKIIYDGSVVVLGDVNPGAQVIAGGDIIILGACRGLAHAGAQGDEKARITANSIVATQLRIAGLIARSPDDLDNSVYVQTAKIKDGTVIIEPVNR